jgi:signal transduction histidine kinase
MIKKAGAGDLISQVTSESWKDELEKTSSAYHFIAAWVAIIFDPVFAFTDYINIPESWKQLLFIRLGISVIVLSLLLFRKKFHLPSYFIVAVTFLLISLQNAYTYSLIGTEDIIGHNLNYIALLIGASLFLLWELKYSILMVSISIIATAFFLNANNGLDLDQFLVQGGVLLLVVAIFMVVLIRARYELTVREIKARLALQESNDEIQAQNEEIISQGEEIRVINENLEKIVLERTKELEKKNKALEDYAFINAHKLRSPVASILGLINLLKKTSLDEEAKNIMPHLLDSTTKLDEIVSDITKTIERGERGNKKY